MADQTPTLGEIIRRQRELTELSMRKFAAMVGISNPYMSQIERGLRDPSEAVLEAIARNLHLSADSLYEQAGMTDAPEDYDHAAVRVAIREDPRLSALGSVRRCSRSMTPSSARTLHDGAVAPGPAHRRPTRDRSSPQPAQVPSR